MQIFLQFDDFFNNKFKIEIFNKSILLKIVRTPCMYCMNFINRQQA